MFSHMTALRLLDKTESVLAGPPPTTIGVKWILFYTPIGMTFWVKMDKFDSSIMLYITEDFPLSKNQLSERSLSFENWWPIWAGD